MQSDTVQDQPWEIQTRVLDGALNLGLLNNGADTGTRLRSWLWSGDVRVDRDREERDRNTAEL